MKKELKDLNRGEIFKEEVKDAKGSEQKGHRPLMVVSDYSFNMENGYALVCPLSKQEYDEPDGIQVKTRKSLVSGWVLTQHLTPYYPEYIKNKTSMVTIVDEVEEEVLKSCLEVFKAISAKTNHSYKGLNQGEIIELNMNGNRKNAVVLSENSFNQCHNSVWVAPIVIETSFNEEPDRVTVEHKELFDNNYGIVYVTEVRNIQAEVRAVKKMNVLLNDVQLKKCLDILNVFFE